MGTISERLHKVAAATAASTSNSSPAPRSDMTTMEEQRKSRTRRLIQVGALTDQYLGTSAMSLEEVEKLLLGIVRGKE